VRPRSRSTTVIVTTTYAAFVCLIALTIVIVTLGSAVLPILQTLVRLSTRSPDSPTQSPTMIAGLRRIATSLWLHFVTSP
jgi:hypothetical protein